MRVVLFVFLGLMLVAAPAAQAALCRCDAKAATESCGCCSDGERQCCCSPESPDSDEAAVDARCACKTLTPQVDEKPSLELPAVTEAALVPLAMPVSAKGSTSPAVETHDPHPEVLAPLLI